MQEQKKNQCNNKTDNKGRDNWNTVEETSQMTAKGSKAQPLIGYYLLSHAQCQYAPP